MIIIIEELHVDTTGNRRENYFKYVIVDIRS